MGRRAHFSVNEQTGLTMFLTAIADHPWAAAGLLQSYSGLTDWEIEKRYQPLALERGLVERADIPAPQRAPRRFGLTPLGASVIGRSWSRAHLGEALLRAVTLDAARLLLTEWVGEAYGLAWAMSPFTISAKDIASESGPSSTGAGYRNLRLDGLACMRFHSQAFTNMALLIDPGGIKVEWFFNQFRGWQHWHRRAEFRGSVGVFPTLVLVAANVRRRGQLISLWQAATSAEGGLLRLRLTTYEALAHSTVKERLWWNERGQAIALWGGLMTNTRPSIRPPSTGGGWNPVASETQVTPVAPIDSRQLSLLTWAQQAKHKSIRFAHLLGLQLLVSAQGRRLLERIGEYPLVTADELAIVDGHSLMALRPSLQQLKSLGLIDHPAPQEAGFTLTGLGVAWLAALIGQTPNAYAALMRWPLRRDESGQRHYSAEAFLAHRAHTRCVLDFLIGLRQYGPKHRLALRVWDHVHCLREFPATPSAINRTDRRSRQPERALPDALGQVRVFGESQRHFVDTDFWLEVDLGTKRGRALTQQLARFYRVGGPRDGLSGRSARILIVVARDDEARLQTVRRRLRMLNERYHARLDVRLTRLDLLEDQRGRLDPARQVWRTPESSEFVAPFNLWEASDPNPKGKTR